MHRCGGQVKAGHPYYWACLREHAFKLLTRVYFKYP